VHCFTIFLSTRQVRLQKPHYTQIRYDGLVKFTGAQSDIILEHNCEWLPIQKLS